MAKVVNSDFPRVQTKKSERLVFASTCFAPGKIGCWVSFANLLPSENDELSGGKNTLSG